MRRKIAIKETPELEIQLKDKTYNILFSNSLLIHYEEKYGSLQETLTQNLNVCDFYAKLIHCYFDFIGEAMSLSECKVLILKGGDLLLTTISECLMDAISLSDDENVKKKVLIARAQLEKLKK